MIITFILTIIIVNVLLIHFGNKHNNNKTYTQEKTNEIKTEEKAIEPEKNYSGIYKQKWLLSYNEKDQFKKIKEITDKYELYIFTKVRLFDLIEPNRNIKNYKEYMWKIQAKHVDFVICTKNLVAKLIIEIDDNSHKGDRKERDIFVDTVLKNCGYNVMRYLNINQIELEQEIQKIFVKKDAN